MMDSETAKAADDVDATGGGTGTMMNASSSSSSSNNNNAVSSSQFPQKLHKMLDAATADGFEDIVRWELDGHAFKVYKVQEFVDQVLPNYFKQSKYKSFQRQLNLYGFQRIGADGPVKKGYQHPNFIRGRPELCPMVTREAGVGGGVGGGGATSGGGSEGDDGGEEDDEHMADTPSSPSPKSSKTKSSTSPTKHIKAKSELTTPKSARNGKASQQTPAVAASSAASAARAGHNSHNLAELQFPYKLYEMLETVERENLTHIVSWSPPSGKDGFKVHNIEEFSSQIMGRFFKQQSKYRSFQRQCNLYGFLRQSSGPNQGGYAHKFFIRGRKDLIAQMQRIKSSSHSSSAKLDPTTSAAKSSISASGAKGSAAKAKTTKGNSQSFPINAPFNPSPNPFMSFPQHPMAGLLQGQVPGFDAEAAVRLLATKTALQKNGLPAFATGGDASFQQNCISAIIYGWPTLRMKLQGNVELQNIMKSMPSQILFDILMNVGGFPTMLPPTMQLPVQQAQPPPPAPSSSSSSKRKKKKTAKKAPGTAGSAAAAAGGGGGSSSGWTEV
eukprot:CAMPEP_0113492838 /NCGR_PEP_ID=MMETSP0014_2-20120614/28284_1 /TAXON_ID=2857 /ORGANISM="Nitzschia sp." /LENGTH=555 /DNA_ID=CAMNT_0000386685 /DNA_START=221 /DNA_END=1888 /DNA_ORIENTATION=+ /assembly_acc=CAM_ASM_000159